MRTFHVIPVPVGWSVEQAWEAIARGDLLVHPGGAPCWAGVETDASDRLIRVLL